MYFSAFSVCINCHFYLVTRDLRLDRLDCHFSLGGLVVERGFRVPDRVIRRLEERLKFEQKLSHQEARWMKPRRKFRPPLITPPKIVDGKSLDFSNGCPKCGNSSLVGIGDETMQYEIAVYCGPCDLRFKLD